MNYPIARAFSVWTNKINLAFRDENSPSSHVIQPIEGEKQIFRWTNKGVYIQEFYVAIMNNEGRICVSGRSYVGNAI